MFDARQLADKATAAGNDDAVVGDVAAAGVQGAPVFAQAGGLGGMKGDLHAAEEVIQINHQVLRLAQAGGNPDGAGVVNKLRLGRDHVDLHRFVGGAQLADGGQRAETGAHNCDSAHGNSLFDSRSL